MTDTKHDYKVQGKKNRKAGKDFEKVVQKDLTNNGWIVFRNSNNCEQVSNDSEDGKVFVFCQTKVKFNPFTRMPMMLQSGFPDFVIVKKFMCNECVEPCGFEVQFVECKLNGRLSPIEKEKVEFIKSVLGIKVLLASKTADGKISYLEL